MLATDWGWKKTNRGLEPITTTADPAPESLLKLISCKCKSKCGKMCGCRKAGLKCSVLCLHCSGETCENVTNIRDLLLEEDYDDDDDNFEDLCSEEVAEPFVDGPDASIESEEEEEIADENVAGPSTKRLRLA